MSNCSCNKKSNSNYIPSKIYVISNVENIKNRPPIDVIKISSKTKEITKDNIKKDGINSTNLNESKLTLEEKENLDKAIKKHSIPTSHDISTED